MKISVIIPVYNEDKTIKEIIGRVVAVPISKEIIVVNDGSSDGTGDILEEIKNDFKNDGNNVLRILHKSNGGKGSALRAGINEASGEIIIFQDADLEYDPGDYPSLIAPILNGGYFGVMGSRFLLSGQNIWAEGRPTLRYLLNHLGLRAITFLTNILYSNDATDYEGCYKAFRTEVLRSFPIEADGFEIDNEIICKIFRRGGKIKEVPIRYYPRTYGKGKKIKPKDGFRILWTILKWRFRSF